MKWVVALGSILVGGAAVVGGVLLFLPTDEIARRAAQEVKAITGRELTIEGPVKASFWPYLRVDTGAVALANADWAEAPALVRADNLHISLETAALLRGEIKISRIALSAPQIALERSARGEANWVFPAAPDSPPAEAGTEATAPALSLAEADLSEGRISFVDHQSGQRHLAEAVKGTIRLGAPDEAAEVRLTARLNGIESSFDLEAGPSAALLRGAMVNGRATIKAGRGQADFNGTFGYAPLRAEGALHLDASKSRDLFAIMGMEPVELPQGFGSERLILDGRVVLHPDLRVVLRDALLQVDGNRLQLALDITQTGPRPKLEGSLTALTPLVVPTTQGSGGQADGGAIGQGWSQSPIDLSPLRLVDANVALALPGIEVSGLTFGAMRAQLVLDEGRANLTLNELLAYQGRLSGTAIANAQGRGSVRLDLTLAGLSMQPLLADLAGTDRLIAKADGTLSLLSSAASMHEMVHRLQGEGEVRLGTGELRGLDIGGMLRNLDLGYVGEGQKTIFTHASTRFSIAEGVARVQDLTLDAPLVSVTGQGTVALGPRQMDIRLTPVALRAADGTGGLSVPLVISGPWSALRYQLDLAAMAKPELRAIEDRAKESVTRQIEERLGAGQGESLEDAAKRKLEQEIQRGLGRLFGN